jgi:hypothetical protein
MTLKETLAQLEAAGSAQTRKTYARHGVGSKQFGFSYAVLGQFAATTPHAEPLGAKWRADAREFVATTGWDVAAQLAMNSTLPDAKFAALLKTVERDLHRSLNLVRYPMNGALIAIGCRNAKLERLAVVAAKRIGKVEVDHGDTSCQTPDAVAYIAKTKARRAKQAKGTGI